MGGFTGNTMSWLPSPSKSAHTGGPASRLGAPSFAMRMMPLPAALKAKKKPSSVVVPSEGTTPTSAPISSPGNFGTASSAIGTAFTTVLSTAGLPGWIGSGMLPNAMEPYVVGVNVPSPADRKAPTPMLRHTTRSSVASIEVPFSGFASAPRWPIAGRVVRGSDVCERMPVSPTKLMRARPGSTPRTSRRPSLSKSAEYSSCACEGPTANDLSANVPSGRRQTLSAPQPKPTGHLPSAEHESEQGHVRSGPRHSNSLFVGPSQSSRLASSMTPLPQTPASRVSSLRHERRPVAERPESNAARSFELT